MSVPGQEHQRPPESGGKNDFSSVKMKEIKAPLWLMILLAAITAIIFIWVMLIVAYPSLALP
jgi:hypothetical protein